MGEAANFGEKSSLYYIFKKKKITVTISSLTPHQHQQLTPFGTAGGIAKGLVKKFLGS